MELWQIILTALLIIMFVPVILLVVWLINVCEEKKISSTETIKTRPPKVISIVFLGFAISVICGGIAGIASMCVKGNDFETVIKVVVVSVFAMFGSLIGFLGYALLRFNYVIAGYDGIYAFRLFRKTKHFHYDEICYFVDGIGVGVIGRLVGFDNFNNEIFSVDSHHTGTSDVANKLREYGVEERGIDVLKFLDSGIED